MDNYPKEYNGGYVSFLGCKIDLSYKPMIPELETRFWVKKAIQDINLSRAESRGKINILDVFAGSGCIGIAILKACPEVNRGIFAEIDENLIKQIKINLKINKINNRRYSVIQSDIFKNIRGKYDYIFANPPYISLKNKHLVQKSVLDYEPHLALLGGEDGLLYIRKFLKEARKFLKEDGKIYLEFDHLQKQELENLLKELNYKDYKFYKDQFQKWRFLIYY